MARVSIPAEKESMTQHNPPRWMEALLRFSLKPRDRETIAGDLLEEYREEILPGRGRRRAQLWYLRQVVSVMDGVKMGAWLGAAFGTVSLLATVFAPLAQDTPLVLAWFFGTMYAIWGFAGFKAYRQTRLLGHAFKVGVVVAFTTLAVYHLMTIVRVNLFLDSIIERPDWQDLLWGFRASGFRSLRTFANYVYFTRAPLRLLLASMMGACTGLLGGLLSMAYYRAKGART